ncbi:ComEC family competence protein [Hartmannibacter diazotrophicus]|uniref:ComEC family competence protein n=1 Tax=Hartmannibacter diazotrophicus TaxID=1482074 RepID=A0A2C9D3S5_9HYPH|nr:ComEC/Rec2 family competence protein [Hartmannibacter diazotrophicus]SON54952.1 ComEC family competence protein [Hartmannibacter diazotrophicus]
MGRLPLGRFSVGYARPVVSLLSGWWRDVEADRADGRGILWLPVMAGAGSATYFLLPGEPGTTILVAAGLAFVSAVVLAWWRAGGLFLMLAMAFAGFLIAKAQTELHRAPALEAERTRTVEAVVERVEVRQNGRGRLTLRPTSISRVRPDEMPARIQLSGRLPGEGLWPGDKVRLLARLSPPSGPVVPGGYDFARVAYFDGIGGTGFALGAIERTAPAGPVSLWRDPMLGLERFRQTIGSSIRSELPGNAGAVAAALIVGDRGAIDPEASEAMRISGLAHVLAISGLHMGLVTAVLYGVARALLAAVPFLALNWPVKQIAAVLGLAGALGYLAVSGMNVPTQRAAIMTTFVLLAVILGRSAISLRLVAVAALAVLLTTPAAALDPGAQMSFAAVTALIATYEWWSNYRRSRPGQGLASGPFGLPARAVRLLAAMAATSLIAGLATAPVAVWHFDRLAPFGLAANLLAMPLVTFLIMPAAVAVAVLMPLGLEGPALAVMGWGIDRMLDIARLVADWTPHGGVVAHPPLAAILLMVAGGLWVALFSRRIRWLGVLPIAAGLLVLPVGRPPSLLVTADGRGALVVTADGTPRGLGRVTSFTMESWLRHMGLDWSARDWRLKENVACDDKACVLTRTALLAGRQHPTADEDRKALSSGEDGAWLSAAPPERETPRPAQHSGRQGTDGPDGSRKGGANHITLVTDPRAFAEECTRAGLVITPLAAPRWCGESALVIDAGQIAGKGATTYRWQDAGNGRWRLDMEAQSLPRGPRPWTASLTGE